MCACRGSADDDSPVRAFPFSNTVQGLESKPEVSVRRRAWLKARIIIGYLLSAIVRFDNYIRFFKFELKSDIKKGIVFILEKLLNNFERLI